MDITITVSEKIEQKIRRQALKTGQDVDKVVADLLEEVCDERFPESETNDDKNEFENPFTPFIGMFSSGITDTSENMRAILYSEDLDPAQGFGTDK